MIKKIAVNVAIVAGCLVIAGLLGQAVAEQPKAISTDTMVPTNQRLTTVDNTTKPVANYVQKALPGAKVQTVSQNKKPASSQASGQQAAKGKVENRVNALSQNAPGLKKDVLRHAVVAYKNAHKEGRVKKNVLTVIDYSKPSSQKRMWVFNLNNNKLLYHTYVSHGVNSGGNKPTKFSNVNGSRKTSLGTFVTADTYMGSNGYSLNLQGLDRGINHNAYQRRIVVHGAEYAKPDSIKRLGRLGRSWGCPAVPSNLAKPIIDTIKNGSVIFSYYPQQQLLAQSSYLQVANLA